MTSEYTKAHSHGVATPDGDVLLWPNVTCSGAASQPASSAPDRFAIAGTTRDTVEEVVNLGGYMYRFIDTAGIRETADVIERMGIDRSIEKVRHAQLVVVLFDALETSLEESVVFLNRVNAVKRADAKVVVCWNKVDLSGKRSGNENEELFIVAKSGESIAPLERWLIEAVQEEVDETATIVTNARHFESLRKSAESLEQLMQGLDTGVPSDLLAVDVRGVLFHLGEITGKISADDILHSIFGKFCIGK